MKVDPILNAFLRAQAADAADFNRRSDLAQLQPLPGDPPQRYVLELRCRGFVRRMDGEIVEAEHFAFGIQFHDDYLRRLDPTTLVTSLRPDIFHPNVTYGAPFVCLGHVSPGMRLIDLCHALFELVAYHKFSPHSALNEAAAEWARNHQSRFPVERRPLLRPLQEKGGAA